VPHHGGRVIAGLIVEHHDLADVLGEQPGQGGGQPPALVTRRHQQGDLRPARAFLRPQCGKQGEVRRHAGQLDGVEGDDRAG
jgi:hypothetical protein